MKFHPLLTFRALFALTISTVASTYVAAQGAQSASIRLAKDPDYLYCSVKIEDAHIQGLSKGISPQSLPNILADDSFSLHISADGKKAVEFTFSAAGGFGYALDGIPAPLFTLRYGVTVDGTLNNSADTDNAWFLEAAIPWAALNATAASPLRGCVQIRAKNSADSVVFPLGSNPALATTWPLFDGTNGAPNLQIKTVKPTIDGQISPNEWPETLYSVPLPVSTNIPATPVTKNTAGVAPQLDSTRNPLTVKWVGAKYLFSTNADLLKPSSPTRGVIARDGSIAFTDQPMLGLGPWYSSDRVDHHRRELNGMQRAGIDVAFTVINGTGAAAALDMKSAYVLATAKLELMHRGEVTPSIAPWITVFRTDEPQDLGTSAGLDMLWNQLQKWFIAVPDWMRQSVTVGSNTSVGTTQVTPIVLDGAGFIIPKDSAWANALRDRFAERFGGLTQINAESIIFVAGSDITMPSLGFHAAASQASSVTSPRVVIVSPGAQASGEIPFQARRLGETYKQNWNATKGADWIIVDSWNDFVRGNEIAPSRQYGEGYVGLTRLYKSIALGVSPTIDIRMDTMGVPRQVQSPELFVARVRIQNTGGAPVEPNAIKIGYRWIQGGNVIASVPTSSRMANVLVGGMATIGNVGVLCTKDGSNPLPPGLYVLEFVVEAANTSRVTRHQIEVMSTPTGRITMTSLSPMVRTGDRVPVLAKVQLSGSTAFPAGTLKLAWTLLDQSRSIILASGETPSTQSVMPGTVETLRSQMLFRGADKQPLEGAFPEQTGTSEGVNLSSHLIVQFTIKDAQGTTLSEIFEQSVGLYPGGDEARIKLLQTFPSQAVQAGSEGRLSLNLANTGVDKWAKGSIGVTGRWFQADGFPMGVNMALPTEYITSEVAVNESVDLTVGFRAPDRPGRYILAMLPMRPPEFFLPTHPITRSEDTVYIGVTVSGGRAIMVDLTNVFDTDAVAFESSPRDGDVDGLGATFPGEWFPVDKFGINAGQSIAPSGYASDISSDIVRSVSFRYGSTGPGAKNAVSGKGQKLNVQATKYVALHIAAVVIGNQPKPLQFVLRYKDGKTETITRQVRDWASPVRPDEAISMRFPRKRMPAGDVDGPLAWQHLVLPVKPTVELVGIELPKDSGLRIFAITLER